MLNSTQVKVLVEVEVELGKMIKIEVPEKNTLLATLSKISELS